MNTHRGLSNRLQWMQQAYQLRADDRVLQKTPFSFDVSVWEFFWPLMTGARLVVAQPGGHQDAEYLRELIQRREITTLHFVPSMLGAFLESGGPQTPGSVRRVICSGEALGKELAQRYLDRMGADLHNLYGPTEAAIDVTFWKCERAALEKGVAIGKPIGNMQVYVLDEQMEPQPVGLPGELYLAGAGLGRGYLARPELTAARWVPDPFSATGGDRLYGTGDLVRYRADGNLEFMGRNDHQVKLRGHRIELGEIESALMGHPDVRQAAVLIRDESLVAYVSGGSGGSKDKDKDEDEIDGSNLNADDLRQSLRAKLPEYMVPSAFVMLNELPLTPSGKTDRRALPAIPVVRDAAQYVAPAGDVEERLCEVWADVLKLKQVGVEDNFFDLGGHSLLATQVMSRVQQIFPVKLRLRVIFRTPTVRGLAQEIESAMRSDAANPHETKPRSPSAPPILTRKTSQMKHSLDELESMSEEEVQALLDAQSS